MSAPAMSDSKLPISKVMRSKEQAKANYDRLSKFYDFLASSSERRFIDWGLEKMDAMSGERVLEIGFGTGYAIEAIANSVGDSGKVYGMDISEGMLNIAQENIRKAGLAERVELKCSDATQLPFENNSLDAVFMSFTLELFDTLEILVVLGECHRVLKSGGRMCVVGMSRPDQPGIAVRLYEWAHEHFPATIDCRPIYIQEALNEAGFKIRASVGKTMWGLPVEIVLAKPD